MRVRTKEQKERRKEGRFAYRGHCREDHQGRWKGGMSLYIQTFFFFQNEVQMVIFKKLEKNPEEECIGFCF